MKMRTIINGKLYDTDTAEKITMVDFCDEWEFCHIYEYLYRKKNGEFFIEREMEGDGDSIDEYNWVLSHRFKPLTIEETKEWVEGYAGVDCYIKLFGMPEE